MVHSFKRYSYTRYKDFENLAINCRLPVDEIEDALWRAENLKLPSSIKHTVISCETSKTDSNETSVIQ